MSISWPLDVKPAPAMLVLPPGAASLDEADAAIELWEHYSKKRLDPTQRLTVRVLMAVAADGRWAAQTTGREMPRQNGKGDEIEVVELWGLVQRAERILHTVHDAVLLATQAQERMLRTLHGPADLRKRVLRVWKGTGQQMIEMRNGGIIWYRTRTAGGGRGVDDIDRLVVDEAQHATDEHIAAIAPTLLANPNPQLNAMGSAGIAGKSMWWWSQRKRAMLPNPGRFAWVGHTAERLELDEDGQVVQHPVDVDDRAVWLAANPATYAGRGEGVAFLEEQYLRMGAALFAREHLGVWDPDPSMSAVVTPWPRGVWQAACDPELEQPREGVVFSLDVNPERSKASIGVGAPGACGLVEERNGTGWALDEAIRLAKKHNARVAVGAAGPAGSMIADLERNGVTVVSLSGPDVRAACGWFFDAVTDRRVRVSPSIELDRAVTVAVKKPAGDAWVWDRKAGDVCSLVAVTFAAWAAQNAPKPDTKPVFAW